MLKTNPAQKDHTDDDIRGVTPRCYINTESGQSFMGYLTYGENGEALRWVAASGIAPNNIENFSECGTYEVKSGCLVYDAVEIDENGYEILNTFRIDNAQIWINTLTSEATYRKLEDGVVSDLELPDGLESFEDANLVDCEFGSPVSLVKKAFEKEYCFETTGSNAVDPVFDIYFSNQHILTGETQASIGHYNASSSSDGKMYGTPRYTVSYVNVAIGSSGVVGEVDRFETPNMAAINTGRHTAISHFDGKLYVYTMNVASSVAELYELDYENDTPTLIATYDFATGSTYSFHGFVIIDENTAYHKAAGTMVKITGWATDAPTYENVEWINEVLASDPNHGYGQLLYANGKLYAANTFRESDLYEIDLEAETITNIVHRDTGDRTERLFSVMRVAPTEEVRPQKGTVTYIYVLGRNNKPYIASKSWLDEVGQCVVPIGDVSISQCHVTDFSPKTHLQQIVESSGSIEIPAGVSGWKVASTDGKQTIDFTVTSNGVPISYKNWNGNSVFYGEGEVSHTITISIDGPQSAAVTWSEKANV